MLAISTSLGLHSERPLAIVGMGNLGQALAAYGGFEDRGFAIAALLDADDDIVGTDVSGHTVEHVDEVADVVADRGVTIAVIATPAGAAQDVADRLVEAGVTALLNFAPTHIAAPESVTVRKVDLSVELQILSFYEQLHANALDEAG